MSDLSHALPKGWHLARFDEIFHRIERKIVIDDSSHYDCVGVRWYGIGAFVRERLSGMNIARKQQWIIKSGDIVYNKLFAWKNAFAIADISVDGCIVSDKFPTYTADLSMIDPQFLSYYFRIPDLGWQAQVLSKGGAAISKLTLNPPQFWDLMIPLPPLKEQQRIVARIQELIAKIEWARELQMEAEKDAEDLISSFLSSQLENIPLNSTLNNVLLEKPRNGWSARCDNLETGVPVLSLGAVTGFTYRKTEFKRTSESTSEFAHYWLEPGDLLITRSNAPDLVGHAAIYDGSPSPCIYPDLMMRLKIKEHIADKRFVHCWLRSTPVREYIRNAIKGTSPTMGKISQDTVMNIPFPSQLSIQRQHHIVLAVENLESAANHLKALQSEASAELNILLPSIFSQAFKGEL
jgi:type I restriction enzyme, S subunit